MSIIVLTSGVSRISFRGGGGVQINFRKVAVFAWRLIGGFGDMLPQKIKKKMVQFGVFWCIFCCNFVQKKVVKMSIFYIKMIDIVLLRTIFRGVGAYSPKCLFIVQFGGFWSTFSRNFLLRKYI